VFNDIAGEYIITSAVQTSLVMRPCHDAPHHGDDCYSVYRAGSDFCLYAHVTYAQAFRHVYGRWPDEDGALALESASNQAIREDMTSQLSYETFRETIEEKLAVAQRKHNLAAERLYERVLFRLVDQPSAALAHLTALVQETHDGEVRAWYEGIVRELTSLPELRGSPGGAEQG
jgi:hypothetical protein